MSITPKVFIAVLHGVLLCTATRLEAVDRESLDRKVQPVIDSTRPWNEAPDAWARLEAAEQMGKLVLDWRGT